MSVQLRKKFNESEAIVHFNLIQSGVHTNFISDKKCNKRDEPCYQHSGLTDMFATMIQHFVPA